MGPSLQLGENHYYREELLFKFSLAQDRLYIFLMTWNLTRQGPLDPQDRLYYQTKY